jgi:hypothetical protein
VARPLDRPVKPNFLLEKNMGQAKARGSKDQRVAEAVERARVAEAIQKAQAQAERKATAERLAARQAAWEKDDAERLARGVKPAIRPPLRGRLNTSTLLAVAALGMLAQR